MKKLQYLGFGSFAVVASESNREPQYLGFGSFGAPNISDQWQYVGFGSLIPR